MSGNRKRKSDHKAPTADEIEAALQLHDVSARTTAKPAKTKNKAFIQVRCGWWRDLDLAPLKVWLHILELDFDKRGPPFDVTTAGLKTCNISRWQKVEGLRELAERGYVSVEWRVRKNPTVTAIHVRTERKKP